VFSFLRIKRKHSESITNPPPSDNAIYTSALSEDSVLSRIRDIVSAPGFTPSSVAPVVNACTAVLSAADFSDLLQTPNIEGHTALYWAIVNNRREAFSVFAAFISEFSSVCSSDLHLACMATSDHALFMQLNLAKVDCKCMVVLPTYECINCINCVAPKDEPLRRSLGCPPDEVQVNEGLRDGLGKNQKFVAYCRIRMFQKRMCITEHVNVEFVAGGMWPMSLGLFLTLTWP